MDFPQHGEVFYFHDQALIQNSQTWEPNSFVEYFLEVFFIEY
jgi:hypothetical protein